ncbi:hypothetical protein EX30DRAFT_338711 [Ascodesmis nigricans]|uniref:Prokaryotic-type class I peptide chain release factors domain-containing protein n=1 Tax=Ascodesmis nigricans TaxID=341454 RepID=A0A4S2N4G6_9PEZI|nr:hypothetical protein EX30DRAFT_338711 [Ascodesmis nigricans]
MPLHPTPTARRLLSFFLPHIHPTIPPRAPLPCLLRPLTSTSHANFAVPMPPRPKVNESEILEKFLHGSGPGGQKINKTSSAVQLKHLPTGIVVKSQATRSRTQNRKIARRLLAERLELMEKGGESRKAKVAEKKKKKKNSADKKKRRKYRKLQEEKDVAMAAAAGVEDVGKVRDEGDIDGEEEGEWVLADIEYNEAEADAEEALEREKERVEDEAHTLVDEVEDETRRVGEVEVGVNTPIESTDEKKSA